MTIFMDGVKNMKLTNIDIARKYTSCNKEHEVSEVICLKCLHRWIAVYPSDTLLKELECECGEVGYVVKTGQTITEDMYLWQR